MSDANAPQECPPALLAAAIESIQRDEVQGLAQVEGLIVDHDRDPRLHFLRGSLLASLKRYDEAQVAMTHAVEIAPGYAIARFQLGLLQLTSGEPDAAINTWRDLKALPQDDTLHLFVIGLEHLIQDHFDEAVAKLRQGIAQNQTFPPLNNDMQMLVDQILEQKGRTQQEEPVSAAHFLLQQYNSKSTKH